MSGVRIVPLQSTLRIPHQFINSAIKGFFSKLTSSYALVTKF